MIGEAAAPPFGVFPYHGCIVLQRRGGVGLAPGDVKVKFWKGWADRSKHYGRCGRVVQGGQHGDAEAGCHQAEHGGTGIGFVDDFWPEAGAGAKFLQPALVVVEYAAQRDEGLVGEVREGDVRAGEEVVAGGQGGVNGGLLDAFEMDLFPHGGKAQACIGEVDCLALQGFDLLARVELLDFDFDFREFFAEQLHYPSQGGLEIAEGIGDP